MTYVPADKPWPGLRLGARSDRTLKLTMSAGGQKRTLMLQPVLNRVEKTDHGLVVGLARQVLSPQP